MVLVLLARFCRVAPRHSSIENFVQLGAVADKSTGVGIAIAVMMRNPQELHMWLEYHKSMGVVGFYVRIEDSPNWVPYLRGREDVWLLDVGESDPHGNNYVTQMDRQGGLVNRAIRLASADPRVQFLFHIDQDELLTGSFDFLDSLPGATKVLHLQNAEARYDVDDPRKNSVCFDAVRFVNCWEPGSGCRSYVNGKAGCRTDGSGVVYNGPHAMRLDSPPSPNAYLEVPPADLHVRHYDSCTLGVYATKFSHMARNADRSKIVFPGYQKAMDVVKVLRDSYRDWASS